MRVLVVTNPFGGLSVGERITDQGEIDAVLAGEHAHHVVQSDHADGEAVRVAASAISARSEPAAEPESDDEHAPATY